MKQTHSYIYIYISVNDPVLPEDTEVLIYQEATEL